MKEKNELEIIKKRLQKAYSMTIREQKKWSKKIKELEVLSVKLEKSTGKHFLDEEGVKLLISANKEISRELSEERWGDGIGKYFEENPEVNELLEACSDIDYAFRIRSFTVLKLKIEKYKEAFKFVEKTYGDTKTLGIRELTPDESKKVDKDLEQIGWL
ncbi:hypothetical protein [Clostridium kluyveri]|uniref:Uncharacterized protein n=1 Tax=Clostridium kluyveri TaxID=1534 RepID=A0A1L5FA45_CLOKL|nr:hypothetical protein [Clostridium kluyveri]APM39891.1 hypothetical protein BS101_14710 [Clostridium kluyveri]